MGRTSTTDQSLGELELEVLRYLAQAGPQSAREAAEGFGDPRGYARTTVLTVIERLRKKGFLARKKEGGVYRYRSLAAAGELMQGVVGRFVERALGGSVSPLVAYLADNPTLSDREVEELRRLVDSLSRKGGKP